MTTLTDDQKRHLESKYSHLLSDMSEGYRSSALRAIAVAEALDNGVNEMGFDYKTFAKVLAGSHRTLQQSSMRAFMAFAAEMAEYDKEQYYDARNEAACKLATSIMALPDRHLPYV
ncbi:MAG: hypothetical protein JSS66_06075 [Armatimonadetes bacterium]|nr:hypothetical protein [Armatimonadota bacterium]